MNEGRWTSHVDGDFVVLLLGARGGGVLGSRRGSALGRMLRLLAELERDPHLGLLGHQRHGRSSGVLVQYWRSADALRRIADPAGPYADTWRPWFGDGRGTGGAPGFWHESFRVAAGDYDAAYHDVPAIGLLRAGVPAPVTDR